MDTDTETKPKKALTRQDQRNLEKLIDSDFQDAVNLLHSAAETHIRTAKKQLEAEHAELEAGATDVVTELQEFEKAIRDQFQAKIEDIKARGYEIIDSYGNTNAHVSSLNVPQRVQPAGKANALRTIQEDAQYAQHEAHRALDSARHRALRGVYVAGISGQAGLDILETIPTAADAFAAALPKREPVAVEGPA